MNPIDVVHIASSSKQAEIQWLIPAINYTPENYTVIYGKDEALLNYSSDTVVGTSDIKETNQLYSITLENLEANTTYYYQVIARNSFGTNSSDVKMLITPLSSKFESFFAAHFYTQCTIAYSSDGILAFQWKHICGRNAENDVLCICKRRSQWQLDASVDWT